MVASNIQKITEDDGDQFARFLLYGQSGIGKTSLAAQAPRSLFLFNDADQGRAAAHAGSTASRWVCSDYDEITEALEYLEHSDDEDFDWVWWDNSSIFQEQGMRQIMEDVHAAKPHRNLWIPDKPEYMMSQARMFGVITTMMKLRMNMGVICHAMEVDDAEQDDGVRIMPMYQGGRGAFSEKVCGVMGVIGYYRFVKARDPNDPRGPKIEVRQLVTQPTGKIYAKDKYGGHIGNMQNPTMDKILPKIEVMPAKKASGTAKKAPAAKKAAGATKRAPAKAAGTVAKRVGAAKRPAAK